VVSGRYAPPPAGFFRLADEEVSKLCTVILRTRGDDAAPNPSSLILRSASQPSSGRRAATMLSVEESNPRSAPSVAGVSDKDSYLLRAQIHRVRPGTIDSRVDPKPTVHPSHNHREHPSQDGVLRCGSPSLAEYERSSGMGGYYGLPPRRLFVPMGFFEAVRAIHKTEEEKRELSRLDTTSPVGGGGKVCRPDGEQGLRSRRFPSVNFRNCTNRGPPLHPESDVFSQVPWCDGAIRWMVPP